jgi:PAS domain S-box-containing protein
MPTAKILIVDDDRLTAESVQEQLEALDYRVAAIAASMSEAIQQAEATRPDLVLMDIVLDNTPSGIDAALAIQTRFALPVIYISAYDHEEDIVQRAAASNPSGYLLKPFSMRELYVTIELALYKHRAEQLLQYRARFAQLIAELSTQFIDAAAEMLDFTIQQALKRVGTFVGVDRCYIVLSSANGQFADNTHEWCADGIPVEIDQLQNVSVEPLTWFAERLLHGDAVVIADLADVPEEVMRNQLGALRREVQSFLLTPMVCSGEVIGVLGLDAVRTRKPWTEEEITSLKTLGNVFANALHRRAMETTLFKKEELFRTVVQSQGEGVGILGSNDQFLFANPAAEQIFGSADGTLSGRNLREFVPGEQFGKVQQEIRLCHQTGLQRVCDFDIQRPDGERRSLLLTTTPRFDSSGRFTGIFGVFRDITERKHAEQQLHLYSDRLEELVRERTLELSQMNEQLHAEIQERNRVEAELNTYHNHLENLIEERTLEFRLANEQLAREIDERRRAEINVQASAERLQTVIETVGEGITLSDETGYFDIFNSKMEELTGYTREEANQADNFLTLLYPNPNDRGNALTGVEEIRRMRTGCRDIETTIQTKGNGLKTLLVSTSIITDQGKNWFLSAYHDITARKEVEQELQRAKEVADAANQAKSEFLAHMSHELRTPLNAVLGYTQLLCHDPQVTGTQKNAIEVIHRSSEHLLTMINDILDLSKIEAHKMEVAPTDFYLPEFLQSIVDIARIRAEQKGIRFTYETIAELPSGVRGDAKLLRQVLLNLLSNAIKFTDHGGVVLRVGGHAQTPVQYLLRFEVEDSGIGIPHHQVANIFLPFHQVHRTSQPMEGTGLGLAISQRIVRVMGGEIRLESTVGQGSTFWFEVSLSQTLHQGPVSATNHLKERRVIGFTGDPQRILIVDDEALNRALLSDILQPLGFEIIEAVDGQDAFDKLRQIHPQVILLDLVMPGVDGFEVARQIRQKPEWRDVKIVAVSASAYEQTRQKSLNCGCDEFIAKPLRMKELLEKLQTLLSLTWVYEELPEAALFPASQTLTLPSPEALSHLFDLASRGHLRKLLRELDELDQTAPQCVFFTSELRDFARQFQMDQMCHYIERYLKKE